MHAFTDSIVPFTLVAKIASMSSSRHVLELGVGEHARVRAQDVDAAEALDRLGRHALAVGRLATSAAMKEAPSSCAAASPASAPRPAMTTFAPACANTPAMPLPMPLVPPVTSTVRPVRGVNTDVVSYVWVDR